MGFNGEAETKIVEDETVDQNCRSLVCLASTFIKRQNGENLTLDNDIVLFYTLMQDPLSYYNMALAVFGFNGEKVKHR